MDKFKILKIGLKRIEVFIPLTDTVPTAVHKMSTGDSQNVHYNYSNLQSLKAPTAKV